MVPYNNYFQVLAKIWPLFDLLAKIGWVLACSSSQNFRNCSQARILDYLKFCKS